jgi:predicted transcriptional regulator
VAALGELERAVMDVLWTAAPRPLSGREVVAALADRDLAYTTVLTVLTRLEKKRVVRRDSSGRAHAYSAAASREEHTAELLHAVLDASGNRSAALVRFVGSVSPAEAAALRRALGADPAPGT